MTHGCEKISLDEVEAALLTHELRKMVSGVDTKEDDQVVALFGDRQEGRSNSRNRNRSRARERGGGSGVVCYRCNKPGHYRAQCPLQKDGKGKDEAQSGCAAGNVAEIAEMFAVSSDEDNRAGWIIDSGCETHMTPMRSHFSTYVPIVGKEVSMGNGTKAKVMGIGTVRIKTQHGAIRILSGVQHIPDLRRSLISVGALAKDGCSTVFSQRKVRVSSGGHFIMGAKRLGGLYVLQGCMTVVGQMREASKCSSSGTKRIHGETEVRSGRQQRQLRYERITTGGGISHGKQKTGWIEKSKGKELESPTYFEMDAYISRVGETGRGASDAGRVDPILATNGVGEEIPTGSVVDSGVSVVGGSLVATTDVVGEEIPAGSVDGLGPTLSVEPLVVDDSERGGVAGSVAKLVKTFELKSCLSPIPLVLEQ